MRDVLIVGGGPAGIATALFLARSAPRWRDRIVVIEKGRYPREKVCAGAVGARAEWLLGTIGVVVDVPGEPVNGIAYRAGQTTRIVRVPRVGRVVRRLEFDHALARVAQHRGIRIIEGDPVVAVHVDRARGVWVQTGGGATFAGEVVVGADGVGSLVRRALGLSAGRWRAQAIEVDTELAAGDPERDLLFFDLSDPDLPGYYWDFPTRVAGRPLVCRGVYALRTHVGRHSPEIQDVLARELDARGLDLSQCSKKRFAERGFEPHVPYARPRALLVGEAAGIDPLTGEGIAQAVEYGAFAGRYLAERLRGGDLEFSDWSLAFAESGVGRDLSVRVRGVGLFHGPSRQDVERFLETTPEFVRVGLQHFAGQRWSRASALRALTRAVGFGARGIFREALGR